MKKTVVLAALAALFLLGMSFTAMAADVSGTWKLEAPQGAPGGGGGGGGAAMERTLVLKQEGSTLTGKMVIKRGDQTNETNIEGGKVDGDNITFTMKQAGRGGGDPVVMTYKAKVTGSKMEGTSAREGGQERPFAATKQ